MKRWASIWTLMALGGVLVATESLEGQGRDRYWDDYDRGSRPRVFLGAAFDVADPVGEFSTFVEDGFGVNGHVRFALDPMGIFSLRLDGGFIRYGSERIPMCLEGVGCRIALDLVTTNNIAFADIGPEVGVDLGIVRPYAGVSAGVSYFHTSSSLEEDGYHGYDYNNFSTVNFEDAVFALRGRGGLQLRVSNGWSPVYLDFAAVYHRNGNAEYLREGDIVDNADGSITLYPNFTEADLVTFHMGLTVGLGGDRDDHDHDRRRRRHGH